MKKLLLSLLTFTLLGMAQAGGAAGPTVRPLTLKLGEVTARAELLLPPGGQKAPLVLLIQGTGPEDMNGSFTTYGHTVPGSLGDLASFLARRGFAVMRFDKRYAAQTFHPATAQAAQASYARLTMRDLLADARTALDAARTQPGVDGSRVYIYGWSEGSVIAAALAQQAGARGLVVQGPVVDSYAATFAKQFETVGLTYLTPYARDGKIDLSGVLAALNGPGSGLARTQAALLLSLDSTPQTPKLATVLDTDHDGKLDLRAEVLPRVAGLYQSLSAQSPLYAPATTLPTLGEVAPRLKLPILILQGENDGNISAAYARQLDAALSAAGNRDHTLRLYAGLGHSLGPAPSITQDNFAPMQSAPMNDLVQWLRAH